MSEHKKLQVVFAPGAFDSFDGTQEELDALVTEIQSMFEDLTPEQIAAQTVALNQDDLTDQEWEILDAAEAEHMMTRTGYLQ